MTDMLKGTGVLELKLPGVPAAFHGRDLDRLSDRIVSELSTLLDAEAVLQHTRLAHHLECATDDKGRCYLKLVIGLQMAAQPRLDFSYATSTLGQLEERVMADREQLVQACRELPSRAATAAMEFTQRVSATYVDEAVDRHALSEQVKAVVSARHRNYPASVLGHPLQIDLPDIPRIDWLPQKFQLRARLERAVKGFTLRFLRRSELPAQLRGVRHLKMPHRPDDENLTLCLEQAQYRGTPVDMTVRVGSLAGRSEPVIADFVALAVPGGLNGVA